MTFAPPAVFNPATLLPETDDTTSTHHCTDILAEEAGTQNDPRDQPWPGSLSCFAVEGKQKAGEAVADGKQVVWA